MLSNPTSPPDQSRCRHCDKPIQPSDRRPREYCSNRCRQAAYRERPQEVNFVTGEPLPRPSAQNSPTAAAAAANSAPLNLLGSGYRWPGANARAGAAKTSAAVDAELGVGGPLVLSPDGVAAAIVPSRKPHSRSVTS
jgi:hypothetical protein